MLNSSLNLRMPLVDHCCGVCTVTKKAHTADWCISSDSCVGGCQCGNYTADCHFPEDETGMNDTDADISYTVLCTPCSDQYTSIEPCQDLCSGECTLELRRNGLGADCYYCTLSKTCGFSGESPPDSTCDCRTDCANVNCDGVVIGSTIVTPCETKTGPLLVTCEPCT